MRARCFAPFSLQHSPTLERLTICHDRTTEQQRQWPNSFCPVDIATTEHFSMSFFQ
jgi:hypothetical protein